MTNLKLARIPERTPVKIAISITPDLNETLQDYAEAYAAAYGRKETVADLIPFMIGAFLTSDRSFTRARGSKR